MNNSLKPDDGLPEDWWKYIPYHGRIDIFFYHSGDRMDLNSRSLLNNSHFKSENKKWFGAIRGITIDKQTIFSRDE